MILANKFYEVQKYLAITNHQYNPQSLIFSKKVWDSLAPTRRRSVQDAAIEAAHLPAPGQSRQGRRATSTR